MTSGPDVRVFGAGLAGCSVAHAIAGRGLRVEIVDPNGLACGASAQRQAVFQPRPGGPTEFDALLVRLGFRFTRALLESLDPDRTFWRDCGVLHLATDIDAARKFARRVEATDDSSDFTVLDRGEVLSRLGLSDDDCSQPIEGGLLIADAGTLEPRPFCHALLAARGSLVTFRGDSSGSPVTNSVVATGAVAKVTPGLERLALRPTRGQATSVHASSLRPLPFVLCNSGYATPPMADGTVTLAGTYGHGDAACDHRDADDRANLERTRERLPPLALATDAAVVLSEVGVRATTADRMPLVGELPHDLWSRELGDGPLFASLGHGSRGTTTAPLTGDWLASWVLGEPRADLDDWRRRLRPERRARPTR